jgi:hypothetical protein
MFTEEDVSETDVNVHCVLNPGAKICILFLFSLPPYMV